MQQRVLHVKMPPKKKLRDTMAEITKANIAFAFMIATTAIAPFNTAG